MLLRTFGFFIWTNTEPLASLFSGLSNPLVSFHTKINVGPTDVAKVLYEDCLT